MKRLPTCLLLFGILLWLGACTEDSDQSQPRTTCGVGFYLKEPYGKQTISNLTVSILDGDTLYRNASLDAISLPLRYVGDTSRFVLTVGENPSDILTIVHKNTPHFISMDAGYAMYYEIVKVECTDYTIEEATGVIPTVNTNEQENISIFYPEF